MTANRKDDSQLVILKNIVPSRYSIDLFILQSVQHHLKISPSGQKGLLMSFVERLHIEQTFWEDYDSPDGTLCVLLSLAVWPYWILRWETSLGFLLKKVWNFLEWVCCLSPSLLHWMCHLWLQTSYCRAVIWYCWRRESWNDCKKNTSKILVTSKRQFDGYISYLCYLSNSVYVYFCALYIGLLT